MLYAIENGLLRTCIWLPLCYVERIINDLNFALKNMNARVVLLESDRKISEGFVAQVLKI